MDVSENGVFLQFYGRCSSEKQRFHPEIFGVFRCPRLVDLYRDSEGWKQSQFTRENTVCVNHLFFALFTYCNMFFTDSING
jgi:hypothetical protein